MTKMLASVLLMFSVICSVTFGEPGIHAIRIRFPGPSSDKIVLPKPAKQEISPYPASGFKPEPPFELPEPTYLPPAEAELSFAPPEGIYGPPAKPDLTYGPSDGINENSESQDLQSATIVNAPLTFSTQFIPPRPNTAVNFRPQSAAIVSDPLTPVSHLTVPPPQRIKAFRPRRPQAHSQQLYPKTYLTLPRVERLIDFRPRRIPNQQHTNFFSRPLPSSIFGNTKNGRSGRPLPSKIFSN